MPPSPRPTRRLNTRRLLALSLALAALGCNRDEIRTYEVPALPETSQQQPPQSPAPSTPAEPTHRMLGAMVKGPDQAWFFKLTGGLAAVTELEDAWREFLETISIEDATGQPKWETPDGWTDRGASGMRLTTLVVPAEGGELDLSVIGLPKTPDWDAQLLDNLNRWRGQMKLADILATELGENTYPIESAPEGSVSIDLIGVFSDGGMSAPFAGRTPPMAAPQQPETQPPAQAADSPITFDLPEGWVDKNPTTMRVANLVTSGEPNAAVAKASRWEEAGAMGDVLANVNRWRAQVGLSPLDEETLDAETESISIDGVEARYVEMTGADRSIYAAMASREGLVWFFLLDGAPDVVAGERDAFRKWVESVRFSE